ncbi:hypothetical protein AAG570_007185, partial [Ranatra chinensis]
FLISVSGTCIPTKAPPQFSATYTVSGTLYIPYAELEEPFFAWYDGSSGSSRIDYYGGMMKTFQLSSLGEFGSSIKIAPVTTEEKMNIDTCLQVNGTKKEKVMPQSILPDLSQFKCLGMEMVNGQECEKWRLVTSFGEKVSKYTMWIRWKQTSSSPKVAVPVKYEMKGYNSLLGSHYDHYYLTYDSFSVEKPEEKVFKIQTNMTCTSFPGPGVDHVYTFNPMKEYVEGHEDHVDSAWEAFKDEHNKKYEHEMEHSRRKEVFRQNMRFIHSKNRANLGFQMAVNHLSDRTDDELRALRGRRHVPGTVNNGGKPFPHDPTNEDVPDQFDWRLFGAVTPVKDQSVCGSCWSFGTTGAMEGAYFVKTGHLLRLSQQALIDCSWGYGNNGCDGGEDFRSYQWIMKHGGLPLESDYGPYYGADGYCHAEQTPMHAPITGWVNVTSGDEAALRLAIFKHGPVSIAIDASLKTFSFYSNGVFFDPDCKNKVDELDHAVLAVGYGRMNGQNYWLVKNSWSNYWGNDGYVLMSSKNNNCGVMTSPTYVTM